MKAFYFYERGAYPESGAVQLDALTIFHAHITHFLFASNSAKPRLSEQDANDGEAVSAELFSA